MSFLFFVLGLTATSMNQLDTDSLRTSLNDTFLEVVSHHEFLKNDPKISKIEIDTNYTNFNLGRIKASLTTQTIPLTSNLNDKLSMALDISTEIENINDDKKSFNFNANLNIQGNTLAILKHISSIVLGECLQQPIDDETSSSVHLQNIVCYVQTGVDKSHTILELKESLQKAINYAKLVYKTDTEKNSIIANLLSSLTITPNEENLILNSTINFSKNLDENDKILITLTLKENGLDVFITGNNIFKDKELNEYINLVKNVIIELQNTESDTHTIYYRDNLYLIFGLLQAFLIYED